MTSPDNEFSFANLSLEPIDDAPGKSAAIKPAAFPNDRRKTQRRDHPERREEIRFQADRRSGSDRRAVKSWEPGSNI